MDAEEGIKPSSDDDVNADNADGVTNDDDADDDDDDDDDASEAET